MTVIKPAPRRPHLDVPELWHYRELLGRFVWRDVKVRYKQTSLGVAWALLVPIFSAVIYVVVFGKFANFPAGRGAVRDAGALGSHRDAVLQLVARPGRA